MERRSFLQGAAAGAGLAATSSASAAVTAPGLTNTRPKDPADLHLLSDPGERRGEMLYRSFGRHDEKISAIGMGGFHLGKNAVSDDEATRLIHAGIERGITFMDNCWDYNGGRSELRMGVALSQGGYRDKVFLMSKMDGRTKQEAMRQIDESLKRLRTDRIDLVQHHLGVLDHEGRHRRRRATQGTSSLDEAGERHLSRNLGNLLAMAKVVSPVGHDAFLTESRQMDRILRNFLTLSQPHPLDVDSTIDYAI